MVFLVYAQAMFLFFVVDRVCCHRFAAKKRLFVEG